MKKAKKVKKQKRSKPAPKTVKKGKAKPEETMDRKALKSVVTQLKGMGVDIKTLKSDTDDALQRKVNEALQKLPSPEVMKKLDSISPDKLVTVMKQSCLGVFVDLSDVSCVRCKDNQACVTAFLKNVKGEFADFDKVVAETKVEEKKPVKETVTPVSRYEPKRAVFVRDVKNPNPKGDPYHDAIQRVLDDQPETLAELRAIIEEDFDIDSDGDFMKFVTALRDPKEGVVKLDVDLSEENKAALRKAGYDV